MSGVIGSQAPEAFEVGSLDGTPVRTNDERHMLLFGGNGSGKSARVILPNLLRMGGLKSLCVTDSKGELAAVSAQWRREKLGHHVVIINPFGVLTEYYADMQGVGFNPLAALNPQSENFESDAALLAEAMISNESKTQPHFDNSARSLVAAVIMYVAIVAGQRGTVPTMTRVRELLCMASEAPRSTNRMKGKGIPKLARVMMRSWCPGLRNKAAQFTDWTPEKSSIASTAQIQTECFDDPQIKRNLEQNDFDFRTLKRKPTTVYIVLPPQQIQRQGKWLRLLLTSALQASMRNREAGEPRILFIMDEFAAIAKGGLPIIETTWALVRGYGIQMMPVFQDLSQLKAIFADRWETFTANAGLTMSFRANDVTTAEWLSKRMGETSRMMETENESENQSGGTNSGRSTSDSGGGSQSGGLNAGWSRSKSINLSMVKTPYMLPQDLYGLADGKMVAFMAGEKDVLHLDADGYFEIESRALRARDNPYVHNVPRRKTLPPPPPASGNSGGGASSPTTPPPPASGSGDTWETGGSTVDMFDQMFGNGGRK